MKQTFYKLLNQEFADGIAKAIAGVAYKEFSEQMKSADAKDTGTFRMIISTDEMDRQMEMVDQNGYDLENYMKNPVVLWGHDYYSMPVGITDRIVREDNKTIAEGRFAPTPEAQKLRAYYEAGFPIAASVGFIPRDGGDGKITKAELLEWSFVPVPANAGCVPVDEARTRGLDLAFLTTKGFDFVKTTTPIEQKKDDKASEIGASCEMDDGTPGILASDPSNPDGALICVPTELAKDPEAIKAYLEAKKSKAAEPDADDKDPKDLNQAEDTLWESIKAEHDMHEKSMKGHIKEYVDAMKEMSDKPEHPDGDNDSDDQPGQDTSGDDSEFDKNGKAFHKTEHLKKLKTVMKAEHERHIKCLDKCLKAYTEAKNPEGQGDPYYNDDDIDASKSLFIKTLQSIAGEKLSDDQALHVWEKVGRTISAATHKKLTELCDKIAEGTDIHTKAIDEFKALLDDAKLGGGDDQQDGKSAAPKQRSISLLGQDEIPSEEFAKLVKTLNIATAEALSKFKKLREGVRSH